MFRILIVDDEPIVREGLKTIVEWEDYGFFICGEGEDGDDGLCKIFALNPDLVLVDIKMPGMNGLELVNEAKNKGYNGKFVILTGYSDFSYAQRAINLGVKSYLLKPIDEDELIKIIKKLYDEIKEEKEVQKLIDNTRRHSINDTIKKIVTGQENISSLYSEIGLLNLDFNFDLFQVALMDISPNEKIKNKDISVEEYVQKSLLAIMNIETFSVEDKLGILFKGQDTAKVRQILYSLIERLEKTMDMKVFTAVGSVQKDLSQVFISYNYAKAVMERKFLYEDLKVAYYEDVRDNLSSKSPDAIDVESVYTFIEVGDMERLDSILVKIERDFKQSNLQSEKIKGLLANCYTELREKIILNYSQYENEMPSKEEIINCIFDKNNLQELLVFMKEVFTSISNTINKSSPDVVMKRILNYIQKNYYKDLKLESLAYIFNYNSAYLGKMFKNYTGEYFNSYLDKVRIENAKVLLNNGLKVYEASEKVGIKNVNYFYKKFKAYSGLSPTEYIGRSHQK